MNKRERKNNQCKKPDILLLTSFALTILVMIIIMINYDKVRKLHKYVHNFRELT